MKRILSLFSIAALLSVYGCSGGSVPKPGPSPSPSVSPTPKPSVTPSPKPSASPSPSPSTTPSPVPSVGELYTAPAAVHAEVDPYVQMFIDIGRENKSDIVKMMKSGAKLKIQIAKLDNLGSTVIGLCETGSGSRTLTLDPDFFRPSQDPMQNYLLVAHELGHCILFRPHRSDTGIIPDGTGHNHELSIMYPIIMGTPQYTTHKPYYDDELYNELDVSGEPKVYICK